jgi:hypothetical protein
MQARRQIDLFGLLLSSLDNLDVAHKSLACFRRQLPCPIITNPAMDTTPTTVDPEQMLEAKVGSQDFVDDFDGNGHEVPAFEADCSPAEMELM